MEFNSILDEGFRLVNGSAFRQDGASLKRSSPVYTEKDTLIRDAQDLLYQQDFVRIQVPLTDLDLGKRAARNVTSAEPEPGGKYAILSQF